MKHTYSWTRLAALFLALALLLPGCAAPADGETTSETGTPSETADTASVTGTLSETDISMFLDDLTNSDTTIQDETDEEDAALLERMGLAEAESIEMTAEDAKEINRAVAGMQAAYVAGPSGEDPLVKSRDWDIYTSSLGQEKLSSRQAEFYNRLDKMCLKYLSTSSLDGVKKSYSNKNYYATQSVKFSDLGLSKSQAATVYKWFLYNHPQYYFLVNAYASDGSSLYPIMYEIMADAEDRAEITNELFDKLDGWIQEIAGNATTTYQKELLANNLLCTENKYEEQYEKPPEGGYRFDQSLYSSVLLGKTVCAGYAKAFCAMMSALGVDATLGISDTHGWNVVRLEDGNCYAVDVCWNDTDRNPPYKNEYLNVGEKIMSATNSRKESHTYREEFAAWIPAIAKEDYNFAEEELPTPQNFRATEVGTDGIRLAWDEVPGADGYEIVLYKDTSRSKVQYSRYTSSPTFNFGSHVPVEPGVTYAFGVRARYPYPHTEEGSDWAYTTATMPADDAEAEQTAEAEQPSAAGQIAAPTNIKAVPTEDGNGVMLSWDPVPGATAYSTCMYDATYVQIVKGSIVTNPADEGEYACKTDLTIGKAYYFGVRAGKEVGGEMVWSDWMKFPYIHKEAAAP